MVGQIAGNAATRESQVMAQLNTLRNSVERLGNFHADLLQRLNLVSAASAPSNPTPGTPKEVLCPLAEQIERVNSQVDAMADAMQDQLRRLEV